MDSLQYRDRPRANRMPGWGNATVIGLMMFVLFMPAQLNAQASRRYAFGVPVFDREGSLLSNSGPVGTIVRSAVGYPLVRIRSVTSEGHSAQSLFELSLADSISVSADYRRWSFRVRTGATFVNSQPVVAEDVVYSLKRCVEQGSLQGVREVWSREEKLAKGRKRDWIDIELTEARTPAEIHRELPPQLAQCPTLEKRTSTLFGDRLGRGTMMVTAGQYRITQYEPGKLVELKKVAVSSLSGTEAQELEIRGFQDSRSALTALRMGNIDVLFSPSEEVERLAETDETLTHGSCEGVPLIYRRGLNIPCSPVLEIQKIKYRTEGV